MGAYLNPPDCPKEDWLESFATEVPDCPNDFVFESSPTRLPVCLIDNGWMTAAGICFSEDEFRQFSDPSDPRPKRWFIASVDQLLGVSNLKQYLD